MYKQPEIEMSIADFHRLPRRLGWKYDYQGGRTIVRPADVEMDVCRSTWIPVPHRPMRSLRLCYVESHNLHALEPLYVDAFLGSPDHFGESAATLRQEAAFSMLLYLSGSCGAPMSCSRAVVNGREPVAAVLVTRSENNPLLHLLMVHPRLQRRGIASFLLAEIVRELRRAGEQSFRSRYMLANEAARRWHLAAGFLELPDRHVVEHCRHFYHYELSRLRSQSSARAQEIEFAERELVKWEGLAEGMRK